MNKTKIEQFHSSDIAASMFPNMRVRWGQSGTGLTLLVNKHELPDSSVWCLVYVPNEADITLSPDGKFSLPPESLPVVSQVIVREGDPLPVLLEKAWTDYFVNKTPPPRFQTNETLVTADQATEWETEFYDELVAPYLHSSEVYAVAHSGVELAKRLGIEAKPIFITHYDETTYQGEEYLDDMFTIPLPDSTEKPILVIDDMVSSRRTAAEIIQYFKANGYHKVRFVALFNVQASCELPELIGEVETYKTVSNFYWLYGRGMDLFSFNSRKLPDIYGAEKRFLEHDSEVNVRELMDYFNIQHQ